MINLRAPQYGTSLKLDCFTKTSYTHGGQIRQIRTTSNTALQLKLVFKNLTPTQKQALKTFLIQNAARRLVLLDENDIRYLGFVTTQKVEFSVATPSLGVTCNRTYNTKLDFEGVVDTDSESVTSDTGNSNQGSTNGPVFPIVPPDPNYRPSL